MKTPEQAAEDYRVAVHEMGHFEIYSHYGINSVPKVFDESEQRPLSTGQITAGICAPDEFGKKETTPFQKSVVGWAGYLAELITGAQKFENGLGVPLTAATLKDWFRVSMCNLNTFSPSDQMLICAVKNPWVTFKAAYHLLRRKKMKLTRYAKFYAEMYFNKPVQSAPQPPVTDPIKFRADLLKKFLADTSPSNLDRPRLQKMLQCLERGEWPTAELTETSQESDLKMPNASSDENIW